MATLVENAIRIKQTFDDIHDAIIGKGASPSGGVDTYAEAIDSIPGQIPVTPENCPFKLVFSAYAQGTTTTNITATTTEVIDEDYFTMSDDIHWQCEKNGRYFAYISVGIHGTVSTSFGTRYYTNNTLVASANKSSAGFFYSFAWQNLSVGDLSKGYIQANGQAVSGRIQIYYLGAV